MALRFFLLQILGLSSKKLNKHEQDVEARSSFAIDKLDFAKGLTIGRSWNTYCLDKTSDKVDFCCEGQSNHKLEFGMAGYDGITRRRRCTQPVAEGFS